jgi:hypothetical protein
MNRSIARGAFLAWRPSGGPTAAEPSLAGTWTLTAADRLQARRLAHPRLWRSIQG